MIGPGVSLKVQDSSEKFADMRKWSWMKGFILGWRERKIVKS